MPNTEIITLQKELDALKAEFYRNNFSSSQDFTKFSRFKTRFMFPTYAVAPTICAVGEAYVNTANGKLYVCSSANTWTAQT